VFRVCVGLLRRGQLPPAEAGSFLGSKIVKKLGVEFELVVGTKRRLRKLTFCNKGVQMFNVDEEVLCQGVRCLVVSIHSYGPNPENTYYVLSPVSPNKLKGSLKSYFKLPVSFKMISK
jgi:hypothetical protein